MNDITELSRLVYLTHPHTYTLTHTPSHTLRPGGGFLRDALLGEGVQHHLEQRSHIVLLAKMEHTTNMLQQCGGI